MAGERFERVRQIMPPDGTDLVEVFGASGGYSSEGLVADEATVRWTARSAETEEVGPEGFFKGWADWLEPWASYRIFYKDGVERGDRVVLFVELRRVTKRDGVEMTQDAGAVFHFDGDQVVDLEFTLEPEGLLGP